MGGPIVPSALRGTFDEEYMKKTIWAFSVDVTHFGRASLTKNTYRSTVSFFVCVAVLRCPVATGAHLLVTYRFCSKTRKEKNGTLHMDFRQRIFISTDDLFTPSPTYLHSINV